MVVNHDESPAGLCGDDSGVVAFGAVFRGVCVACGLGVAVALVAEVSTCGADIDDDAIGLVSEELYHEVWDTVCSLGEVIHIAGANGTGGSTLGGLSRFL